MAGSHLLGIDVGGGGGRCLLLEIESGRSWTAERAWTHPAAPGTAGMGIDLDLPALWRALGAATRDVLERAGVRPEAVAGVAAASMRFATVVTDRDGETLLAAPNRDGRAAGEAFQLAAEHGETLYATSGHWPLPILPVARLRWLAAQQPERFRRAAHVLALSEWIGLQLSGELRADRSQAASAALLDLADGRWSDMLCAKLGLDAALLPALAPAGSPLGELTPRAAEALGLRAGTPVGVGAADSQSALVGAGSLSDGQVCIVAGTTAPVMRVSDTPLRDPEGRLWTGCHALPGRYVLESNAGALGESLDWIASLLFPAAPQPAARLLAEAAPVEPGAGGLLSTLGGEIFDGRKASIPTGRLTLSVLTGPDPRNRPAQAARAVSEGLAFALRANLEQLRACAGDEVGPVALCGGISRSESFSGLLADVLGRPVLAADCAQTTALGAALLAGVAGGVWSDLEQAVAANPRTRPLREPDPERVERYAGLYEGWTRLLASEAESRDTAAGLVLPDVLRARQSAAPARSGAFRPRILVTADLDADALTALRQLGEVEYAPFRERMRLLTGATLVEALADVDVFVTEIDVVDADALAALPQLRVIAACRGDAVNVDAEACTAFGIPVLFAPGRNAESVADLTLAFMLMLARKLAEANAFLREPGSVAGDMGRMGQAFGSLRGVELGGSDVGLIGLGAVGRAVARRLAAFGARVRVYDPFVPTEAVIRAGATPVSLDSLLAESDFVSLHAAVSEQTRGLIGAAELARMKPGACLVNTARAALVDEEALAAALAAGQLAGAAIDVFSVEPPGADHPLLQHPNVIGTPHVGGNTRDIGRHQGRIVGADLARLVRGEPALHIRNPEVLAAFDWTGPRPRPDPDRLAALRAAAGPAVTDLERDRPGARTPAVSSTSGATATSAASGHVVGAQDQGGTEAAVARSKVVTAVQRIIEDFTRAAAEDPRLREQAAGREVTLHFHVPDVEAEFHLRLDGERVHAAPGPPDAEAEVNLRLPADILDGMFTDRVNPMQAAMEGRLSFSGDTAKAMTLQQLQDDLSRLYRDARDRVGDPGDLASLPDPDAGPAATAEAPGDDRTLLVRVVEELYAQELITATGGNVSMRSDADDGRLWITPSQLFKGDLRPELLVGIGLDGKPLESGGPAASSERMIHCAIYRERPDARAVVHAHAPHATILANSGLPFLPISTEAAFFGELPRIPFIMPGTQALADAVGEAIRDSWAVLLVNHGLIVAGRSLRRAADMAEIIDRSAQVILGCHAVGREPPVLPDDVVKTLREMGDLVA